MRRPEVGILALAVIAACAIPTEAPNWDMTWNLPMPDKGNQTIDVTSFLPTGVTVAPPAAAFNVAVSSVPPINRTLGAQCPACPNGTATKPAFIAPLATTTISLTASTALTSGTLTTGSQMVIAMTNGFQFDPIRPPGGPTGTITFTLDNGGVTIGNPLVISGATSAIPPGQTTSFTMPLTGVFTPSAGLSVKMTMDSPAGSAAQPVAMNPAQPFTATVTPTLKISTATVTIGAQPVSTTASPMDLSGLDSAVVNRVRDTTATQGSIFMTITNPFTVSGAMTVTFASQPGEPPMTPVTRNLAVKPATNATTPSTSVDTLAFSGRELRSMLGKKLNVTFGGNTGAGSLTVTPTQKMTVTSRMQLTFWLQENK
jgi:hypothetical protein